MLQRWSLILLTGLTFLRLIAMIDGMRPHTQTIPIGMGQTWTSQTSPRAWKWFWQNGSQTEIVLGGLNLTIVLRPPNLPRPTAIHIPLIAVVAASALYPVIAFVRRSRDGKPEEDVSIIVALAVFLIVGSIAAEAFNYLFWAYYPYFSEDYFLLEFAIGIGALVAAAVIAFFLARFARRRVRRGHRQRVGLCVACGYNLAGSPGGVCPECGMSFPSLDIADEADERSSP